MIRAFYPGLFLNKEFNNSISSDTSDESDLNLWNMVRVINILIMVRLLRIIWHIKVVVYIHY